MGAAKQMRVFLTFKALLAKRLMDQFPGESFDEIDARADRLIRTCKPKGELEEAAFRGALGDRARMRGFA